MPTPEGEAKAQQVYAGTDAAYKFAKAFNIKTAWGTDILFDSNMTVHQGAILTTLERWYRPAEILKMATAVNGELLAMSGPRNPYPGKLGVIEAGALADLIVVDGDPLANLKLDRRSGQEFPRHHEGRAGGQGYAGVTASPRRLAKVPNSWYCSAIMSRNTSVSLGDHFADFIEAAGRRWPLRLCERRGARRLRLLEEHEARLSALQAALIEGERSGEPEAVRL